MKWAEDLNKHSLKEEVQIVYNYMKNMFNITNHQEKANKCCDELTFP